MDVYARAATVPRYANVMAKVQEGFRTGKYDQRPILSKDNSKMACLTMNLPAIITCAPYRRGKDAVCRQCYACSGHYLWPDCAEGQLWRFVLATNCPRNFVQRVTHQLDCYRGEYVRLHDSGDFFSHEYLERWSWIAREQPRLKFLAFTKLWRLAGWRYDLERAVARAHNLIIRPSALRIEDPPPKPESWGFGKLSAGATVSRVHCTCRALESHESCESVGCRMCWDEPDRPVCFRLH